MIDPKQLPNLLRYAGKAGQCVKSCEHFEPGIFNHNEKRFKPAVSCLEWDDKGCNCKECGMRLSRREGRKVNAVVEYLNSGGNDDKTLSKLYYGVTVGEMIYLGGNRFFTQGAGISREFVPRKNKIK